MNKLCKVQLKFDLGGKTCFLSLQKSPSMVIYISLFQSSLLSLPTTKTLSMAFRHSEKLKTCDWEEQKMSEIHDESLYAI